jgi:SAM-dependent MidA family methyltransferase
VLARALDTWWDGLGRPDPFVVVEAGAGTGTLARSILDAEPACAPALRYLLVERSGALRERQAERLPLEPAAWVLGPVEDDDDEGRHARADQGPLVASLEELPTLRFSGVVIANELLDNLTFSLLEWRDGRWREVRVGAGLDEVLVPAPPLLADEARRLVPEPPDEGCRIPIQHQSGDWVRSARRLLERGRVVAIDYCATTVELAGRPWPEWVRTYRGHGRGGHPLERPGTQDITCEVCVDQLPPPTAHSSQAEFLRRHGLDELTAEARAEWEVAAATPTVAALKAKSRVSEADALTDGTGLGAFRVLEWEVSTRRRF